MGRIEGHNRFDAVLKELFIEGQPQFLMRLTSGRPVAEHLNVELPKVLERRPDLVFRLADQTIFHLELQSTNDRRMAHRMAIMHVLLDWRFRAPARHLVLYMGAPKMRMPARVETPAMKFTYSLMDIRDEDADTLLNSQFPADLVLAMLARGGAAHLGEIVSRVNALPQSQREKALVQLILLAGLRNLSQRLQLEVRKVGMVIDVSKNVIVQQWWKDATTQGLEKGLEKGREEGRAEGQRQLLTKQLRSKFGRVPVWARQRVDHATSAQLEKWAEKILTASAIEDVVGRRNGS